MQPSEKRDGNCHVLADSRWEMLLKAVGQPLSTAKRVSKSRWWKSPKAIGKPLGNSWRVSESRWEMPKCPLLANRRGGRIAQRLLAKMWQFPFISSELQRFCLHLLKVEEAMENFKNAQRFFFYFCPFQPYHLLPDSYWCDSPFKASRLRKPCCTNVAWLTITIIFWTRL